MFFVSADSDFSLLVFLLRSLAVRSFDKENARTRRYKPRFIRFISLLGLQELSATTDCLTPDHLLRYQAFHLYAEVFHLCCFEIPFQQ